MPFLILQKQRISFEDIPSAINTEGFTLYSKEVLSFCSQWLSNSASFEITTSGSTGDPKNILWSRDLMKWSINNTVAALYLKPGMQSMVCIDIRKAGGKMMLARALHLGMNIEVVEPSSDPFRDCITDHFDFAAMVPMQIQNLQIHNQLEELNKIDTLIIGGAPISNSLNLALQIIETKIYATYGMTETASHIALQQINGPGKEKYFTPLPGVTINVNENSCAVITTPLHLNLVTNDIIRLHENNTFEVIGRYDNIINSGGYKIPLEKVESALEQVLTSLKINFFDFFVYKEPDEKLGEKLIAVFNTTPLEQSLHDIIISELQTHLEKFELPKQFYFIEKLVYTPSGKIDRKKSARGLSESEFTEFENFHNSFLRFSEFNA